MAELKPCPFCGGEAVIRVNMGIEYICPIHERSCVIKPNTWLQSNLPIKKQIKAWNTRTKEIGADGIGRYDHYTDTFIKERGGEK